MSLEILRCLKPDHRKPVCEMEPQEILNELLFLEAGYADDTTRNGVKAGLSSELRARLSDLRNYVLGCIKSAQQEPVASELYES